MATPYLLQQLLGESAQNHPDSTALVCRDVSMTYQQLDEESSRLANRLAALGVAKGARIAIHMGRSSESIVGIFATLKAGAAYVPIDPLTPPDRLNYLVAKCRVTCMLTTRGSLAGLSRVFSSASVLQHVLIMDGLEASESIDDARLINWPATRTGVPADAPRSASMDLDLAYVLFTSGSTGNPKGVMLSHRNSLTFVNMAHDFFAINSTDRLSNVCPLHSDMSVFDIFVAVKAAAAMVIIPETTAMFPVKLAEAVAGSRVSVWNSVPSVLSLLATYKNLARHDLTSLRLVLFAGEVFPVKHLRVLLSAIPSARFCNMYGQTEANSSTHFWIRRPLADTTSAIPIGRALPNFDVFALDEQGRPLTGPGGEGELYVSGSTVAAGYWEEPEITRLRFLKHPLDSASHERVYRTGDLVRIDTDGNYVFAGRKDLMVKSRGYRVEIGEIEAALSHHPAVQQAVVIPVPDELVGNKIAAIVVPTTPDGLSRQDVLKHCLARLPKYMVPDTVEFRKFLPVTPSGKVDRERLRDESILALAASGTAGKPRAVESVE